MEYNNNSEKPKFKIKIALLGDQSVGKTSISNRLIKEEWKVNSPTIGACFKTYLYEQKNRVIQFDIWDTAGEEKFRSICSLYYKNSKVVLIVYDLNNENSFEIALYWIKELNENLNEACVILIGNKLDLEIKCDEKKIEEYCKENNIIHMKTSAKNNIGVSQIFPKISNFISREFTTKFI